MVSDTHNDRSRAGRGARGIADVLAGLLEDAPVAFAATRGADHVVAFANAQFRHLLTTDGKAGIHHPISRVLDMPGLERLLDRALEQNLALCDQPVGDGSDDGAWNCTVWPLQHGHPPGGLVIELRTRDAADSSNALQRDVAERMLLGALHEQELAEAAHLSAERATFLAEAGRQLASSVDVKTTREAIAALHLPRYAAWCIVDVLEDSGTMVRLAIVHPEADKQAAAQRLADRWSPQRDDPFGLPAMLRDPRPLAITEDIDAVVAVAAHDAGMLRALRELGLGPLLTVPMLARGHVSGAITFVGVPGTARFSPADVQLARDLALRSALALENARLFGEAVELRTAAQTANKAKSDFLAHMSHELRTPLNAIAGYVDLMDLEIHGPVTTSQRSDLQRIKASQQHLLIMINDILNFMQVERGGLAYHLIDLPAREILHEAFVMMEPAVAAKQLAATGFDCDAGIIMRADRDRTLQILVNLLGNAVKFSQSGGQIDAACSVVGQVVHLTVSDTGIGIPIDRQDAVFEPFMQVRSGLTERQGGVGLGLAISRDLARGMNGDITLESTPGQGSRFTLTLPRAT